MPANTLKHMGPDTSSTTAFRHDLLSLGERYADPIAGFFGPKSLSWRVYKEALLLLVGMRALLLQVAHPKVAQAVAEHSRFREAPLKRAIRTFESVHAIVFGTPDEAIGAALKVYETHRRVRGSLPDSLDVAAEPSYSANDPELLMWVFATLIDSAVVGYEAFFFNLGSGQREAFYAEGKRFARVFGIPLSSLPVTWADFEVWFQDTINGKGIAVTPAARELARSLLTGSLLLLLLAPMNYALAAGFLPPKLRLEFGLKWDPAVRLGFAIWVNLIRWLGRMVPEQLRIVPAARRALRRCRAATERL